MLTDETVRSLVQRALLASSSHNTQPWRFRTSPSTIDLLADRTRALPVNDPFDRELTISCGAALMTLRVAIAASGQGARIRMLPDPGDGDWLARVEVTTDPPDAELSALAPFIEQRRTYRKAFETREVAAEIMASIATATEAEGCRLLTLVDTQRPEAGSLVAEGDRMQWDDPRWRRELALWMHPRREGDGLIVPALAVPIAQAVVRTFDLGNGVAAKDQQLLLGSPWLTVLTTAEDDTAAWLRAGQALQRALLTGCRHGLQASYLNQPIQVTPLRERLRSVLGTEAYPQMLMRWGHPASAAPATPRRKVDAVIEMSA